MKTKDLIEMVRIEKELEKKYEYKNKNILLNNFLDQKLADDLYDFLVKKTDWNFNSYPPFGVPNENEEPLILKKSKENQKKIKEAKDIAYEHCKKGAFAYSFYNSNIHCECENCAVCFFEKSLSFFFDDLSKIYNKKITKTFELNVFKYTEGDFLTRHSDDINGDITFVFQLSKNWIPEYGGLLHFCQKDYYENDLIVYSQIPTFNTLNVFLTENKKEHFVSHVSPNIDIPRITITGWAKFS